MNYCKIKSNGCAMLMPNPVRLSIANPTEDQKKLLSTLDNWLPMEYTDKPEYDLETEYLIESWIEKDGKAIQVWEKHKIEVK